MEKMAGWRSLVTTMEGTPRFYIALFLVLESGLGALVITTPTAQVQQIAGLGMVTVAILMVIITARNYEFGQRPEADPDSINPLWGPGSLPLDAEHVSIFKGDWHCEWEARARTGDLEPYVDDTVKVTKVDQETSEFEAIATSSYEGADTYEVKGRVSKNGVAHLYYRFPAPHDDKVGMAILEISFVSKRAEGWWMGGGRGDDRNVGGLTTWIKAEVDDRDWVEVYEFTAD